MSRRLGVLIFAFSAALPLLGLSHSAPAAAPRAPRELGPSLSLTYQERRHITIDFSPDGKKVVAAAGRYVVVYCADTGKVLCKAEPFDSWADYTAFGPKGSVICASHADSEIAWLDERTLKPRKLFTHKYTYPRRWLLSPDRRILALGRKGAVVFWDAVKGTVLREVGLGHDSVIEGLAFSGDGRTLVAVNTEGFIHLIDPQTGKEARMDIREIWPGGAQGVGSIVIFSPVEPTVVLAYRRINRLVLWDARKHERKTGVHWGWHGEALLEALRRKEIDPEDLPAGVEDFAFSPDGTTIATCGDGKVRLFEAATLTLRYTADVPARVLCFSPDGSRLATSNFRDDGARIWKWREAGLDRWAERGRVTDDLLWAALGSPDPANAHYAIGTLSLAPKRAVALLRSRLRPVPRIDEKDQRRMIAELDSDDFDTRERAEVKMKQAGRLMQRALQAAMEDRPSAQLRRTVKRLLPLLEGLTREELRAARCVEVLEAVAGAEAIEFLKRLAAGAAGAKLTEAAEAALRRTQR